MKKILYIFTLAAVVFTSCSRDEESLFDKSAAERVQAKQSELKNFLTSAENGWEMHYFPYPDAAGYAFLCQFNENGSVRIAAKNSISSYNIYKEEVSLWATDASQSGVLTFNTYNTLFSIFADPGDDGVGHNGDYEFVIMGYDADCIRLKGKKHGAYIQMYRLANDVVWENYFDRIDAFFNNIFRGNEGIQMLYTDGDTIYEATYNSGAFTYKNRNDEEESKGFIITPTGLHFYSGCPQHGTDALAKDFVADDAGTKLYCTSNNEAFFMSGYTPSEFFAYKFTKLNRWIYTEEGTDAATVAAVNEIKSLAAANGAEITRLAYDFYYTINSRTGTKIPHYAFYISYLVDQKLFEGRLTCNFSEGEGVLTYSYVSTEKTLNALMERIDADPAVAAAKICDIFMGSYTASSYTGTLLNMVQMLLTSTENDNKFIHVIADTTK